VGVSIQARTPFLAVRDLAQRLDGDAGDYDGVVALAEGKTFVLLGEATHGTRDFYRLRADISRRLIEEQGFDAVAVEGDWPDAWRVNRFVQGGGEDNAETSLDDFERFPEWMWRNREVREFVGWLREHNRGRPESARAGFYGLDMYSLYRSADAVIEYLGRVDPEEAELARRRYAALDHVREPQVYGLQAAAGRRAGARAGALEQLHLLRAAETEYLSRNGLAAFDEQFFAERNAALVVSAEAYYRAMFGGRTNTWNLRDAHMRDTLFALAGYRHRRGGSGRVIVWAHNSHVGDSRATEMHEREEWNLGQLVREQVGDDALLVGFTTCTGTVSAASEWGGEVECKRVRPALPDSWEHLFHTTRLDRFFLPLREPAAEPLHEVMLERAIGVLYLPQTERTSHYFDASLAAQFDAVFHLDETEAVEPLEQPHRWRTARAGALAAQ
jgi:erythromycin esterase-like protein